MALPDFNNIDYFTNRGLENESGERKGKIVMWREKGREESHFILNCPYCGHHTEKDEVFSKKPYRPKCEKCGRSVVISKIKAPK